MFESVGYPVAMTDYEKELMKLVHKWSSQAIDASENGAEAYRDARDDLCALIEASGEHRLAGAEPSKTPADAPRDDNNDPILTQDE